MTPAFLIPTFRLEWIAQDYTGKERVGVLDPVGQDDLPVIMRVLSHQPGLKKIVVTWNDPSSPPASLPVVPSEQDTAELRP